MALELLVLSLDLIKNHIAVMGVEVIHRQYFSQFNRKDHGYTYNADEDVEEDEMVYSIYSKYVWFKFWKWIKQLNFILYWIDEE